MSRRRGFPAVAALASILLLPSAALAFDPQPDPPGKRVERQRKGLGGPDTKAFKAPAKGSKVLVPAVQSPREAARRAQ